MELQKHTCILVLSRTKKAWHVKPYGLTNHISFPARFWGDCSPWSLLHMPWDH